MSFFEGWRKKHVPPSVEQAKVAGDAEALSALGAAGARARIEKKEHRDAAIQAQRITEAERMIEERGGDPED